MLKVEERVINNKLFRVEQLPVKEGRHVLLRILKVIAPPTSAFLSSLDEENLKTASFQDMNVPFKAIAAAIAQLPFILNEVDIDFLIDHFAKKTSFQMPNGNFITLLGDGAFLNAFGGEDGLDYKMQSSWLLFAAEVNYKSFLNGPDGLKGLSQMVNQAQQSKSQNTSTGTSTGLRSANTINQA